MKSVQMSYFPTSNINEKYALEKHSMQSREINTEKLQITGIMPKPTHT